MIKSVFKKSLPFKSYSKNSELPSKKFLIKMSIFVLQRYLCYKYWAMCYEVFLMCYNRSPFNILCFKNGKNRFNFFWVLLFEPRIEDLKKTFIKNKKHGAFGKRLKFLNI